MNYIKYSLVLALIVILVFLLKNALSPTHIVEPTPALNPLAMRIKQQKEREQRELHQKK